MGQIARKDFFGVVVSAAILRNRELTITEKLVYSYIASYAKKVCCDSNEKIAERLGLSARTLTRALRELQEKGFVFIDFERGSTSRRKIYDVFDKPSKLKLLARKARVSGQKFSTTFPQPSKRGVRLDKMARRLDKMASQITGND